MSEFENIITIFFFVFISFLISTTIYSILSANFLWGIRGSVYDFDRMLKKKEKYESLARDLSNDNFSESILEKSGKNIDDELKRCFNNVECERNRIDEKIASLLSTTNHKAIQRYVDKTKHGRSGEAYQRSSVIIAEYKSVYYPEK